MGTNLITKFVSGFMVTKACRQFSTLKCIIKCIRELDFIDADGCRRHNMLVTDVGDSFGTNILIITNMFLFELFSGKSPIYFSRLNESILAIKCNKREEQDFMIKTNKILCPVQAMKHVNFGH